MKHFNTALLLLIPSTTLAAGMGGSGLMTADITPAHTDFPDVTTFTGYDETAGYTAETPTVVKWSFPAIPANKITFTLTDIGAEGYMDLLDAVGVTSSGDIVNAITTKMTVKSDKGTSTEDGTESSITLGGGANCMQSDDCTLAADQNGMQEIIPAFANAVECSMPSVIDAPETAVDARISTTAWTTAANAYASASNTAADQITFAKRANTLCGWDVPYTMKYDVSLSFQDAQSGHIGNDLTVEVTSTHTYGFAGFSPTVDVTGALSYVAGQLENHDTDDVTSTDTDTSGTTDSDDLTASVVFANTNTITCTGAIVQVGATCAVDAICAFKFTASCQPAADYANWMTGEEITVTYLDLLNGAATNAFTTIDTAITPANAALTDSKGIHTWADGTECSPTAAVTANDADNCLFLSSNSDDIKQLNADSTETSVAAAKFEPFGDSLAAGAVFTEDTAVA